MPRTIERMAEPRRICNVLSSKLSRNRLMNVGIGGDANSFVPKLRMSNQLISSILIQFSRDVLGLA